MPKTTMMERLTFLAREMALAEQDVLSKAIEVGIDTLYGETMCEKYQAGEISREDALSLLGPRQVARLECLMRECEAEDEFESELDLICSHS